MRSALLTTIGVGSGQAVIKFVAEVEMPYPVERVRAYMGDLRYESEFSPFTVEVRAFMGRQHDYQVGVAKYEPHHKVAYEWGCPLADDVVPHALPYAPGDACPLLYQGPTRQRRWAPQARRALPGRIVRRNREYEIRRVSMLLDRGMAVRWLPASAQDERGCVRWQN
jgi:hypothetical protein